MVQPLVNRVGQWLWRRDLRRRSAAGSISESADRLVTIDPGRIETQVPASEVPLGGFALRDAVGRPFDGDWDQRTRRLADHPVVVGIQQRFAEGRAWEETRLYRVAMEGLERGRPLWKFRTRADVPRLLAKIDALHAAMAADGYRSQQELGSRRSWDEILVAIDRVGRLHLVDGVHRLAVARVLGLSTVPVLVVVRHAAWESFRREMLQYARDREVGLYQRLDHPDLDVVPFVHGPDRWELIRGHLPAPPGTALDIGANAGLFSARLARVGFEVTAVERSEKEAYVLGRLIGAWELPIRLVKSSIFDAEIEPHYDVVLALNIFHHFLKGKSTLHRLQEFLKDLSAERIFLEVHDPAESQMKNAFFNPEPMEFAEWVAERVGLRSIRKIGEPAGRRLYLLEEGEER